MSDGTVERENRYSVHCELGEDFAYILDRKKFSTFSWFKRWFGSGTADAIVTCGSRSKMIEEAKKLNESNTNEV
ncbi:hypothetical protein KBA63_03435 [Candidatus Woesebacteria bacterium]|jgi:peptidyl-tRNA hydrolase|nr:hypothetical protein [Candidatus Woesebacteria bacterium]MBP9687549.1 hypothetical protein [Candidatus Woesebacteria bacterium]